MTNEEITSRVIQHDVEIKHHTEQIAVLQDNNKVLQDMATSLAVMAKDQKALTGKVDAVIKKVDVLEAKPAKYWDSVVTALIGAVVGVLIGFLMRGGL